MKIDTTFASSFLATKNNYIHTSKSQNRPQVVAQGMTI